MFSKITRPKAQNIVERQRLFSLLDKAGDKPITWVSASAGSGKTTLVASYVDSRKLPCLWYQVDSGDSDLATFFYYMGLAAKKANPRKIKPMPLLTPEYLGGIPAFTRKYFEELFSRLLAHHAPRTTLNCFTIVFDNYQDVPNPQFHEMIINGLEVMPEGFRIIVISRSQPPSQLARFFANDKISLIQDGDMRFTPEESRKLVSLRVSRPGDRLMKAVLEKTGGWAAGMVLMTEIDRLKGETSGNFASEAVFDYFAREIFNKAEKEVRDFLLKTAFLPVLNVSIAEKLTGSGNAGRILAELNCQHYFTDRLSGGNDYLYHPLFRGFLIEKANKIFSREEVTSIQYHAAVLLEESGRTEDALLLFADAGAWEKLSCLILNRAGAFIAEGRNKTLEKWITAIPRELLENTPWLLYWLGVSRLPFDPMQSRSHFEKALNIFDEQKDAAGVFLSWTGITDTFVIFWKDLSPLPLWVNRLYEIMEKYKTFPSPQIEARVTCNMFAALSHGLPHHPDTGLWADRARALIQASPDNNLRVMTSGMMLNYYACIGDYAKMTLLVEELRQAVKARDVTALSRIWACMAEAVYCWAGGSFDACIRLVEKGIETAEASAVHIGDGFLIAQAVYAGCLSGDYETASKYIRKIEKTLERTNNLELSHYNFLCALLALSKGESRLAVERGESNLAITKRSGMPFGVGLNHIVLANAYIETGAYDKAKACIAEAQAIGYGMGSRTLEYNCAISGAHIAMQKGDDKTCLEYMLKALSLAKEMGFVNIFYTRRPAMSRLLAKALEAGIETRQTQEFIQKSGLEPPEAAPETWPYPIKIYALGRFEMLKDDAPVTFSGRVQQKPLALLKAIIASGGSDAPVQKLSDDLWPEADGDKAAQSFKFTLYALRKLLGNEAYIQLKEGRLTLNPDYCRVDVRQLQDLLRRMDSSASDAGFAKLCEQAMSLYRGDFLADEMHTWVVPLREKLKHKFMQLIDGMCDYYEKTGEYGSALKTCRKALEIDNLQEDFYRRLMLCYMKLGRRADALAAYQRCKNILSAVLGVEPSTKTEEIHRKIRFSPNLPLTSGLL